MGGKSSISFVGGDVQKVSRWRDHHRDNWREF